MRGAAPLVLLAALAPLVVLVAYHAPGAEGDNPAPAATKSEPGEPDVTDPLGANAACYVCHMTFVREEISKVHLAAKVGCIKCHGLSAAHANDEDIGATKPDIVFKRDQVDKMCSECHEEHNAPAREVVARFIERKLTGSGAACTDCHGTHKIEEAAVEEATQGTAAGG